MFTPVIGIWSVQIIIQILRAYHVLYKFISDNIKIYNKWIYGFITALIRMYKLFKLF